MLTIKHPKYLYDATKNKNMMRAQAKSQFGRENNKEPGNNAKLGTLADF